MIKAWAYDVEVFPNMFSITFVNIPSYMKAFADISSKEALTEKLSVAEIKKRLETVETKIFFVSDTDDSQMLPLVEFLTSMYAHYDDEVPIRYDLYGYNNQGYDDFIVKEFLMRFDKFDNVSLLLKHLYNLSKNIISLQDDKEAFWQDKTIAEIRRFRLPYATVDLFKIFALNSAGVNVDKDTGVRKKFAKSLKQTSINLKWHELLDFVLPPIDEKEASLYWHKKPEYKGISLEELNSMGINDFDRYVLPKYVQPMLHYNTNDVFLVCEIARQKPDEIRLRYSLGQAFHLNLLCSSRSNIADKLLEQFYSRKSGLNRNAFKGLRTKRTGLYFKSIIFPHIKFKTPQLQQMLKEMKDVVIYHTTKDSFCREETFMGTTYTLATGGIHSVDGPDVFKSDEDLFYYTHWDYASYYPSIMIAYNIAPKHLNQRVFTDLVRYFRDTRVKAKHTKDNVEQVIGGVPNKLTAEALKIVINSIYGKFGDENFWLYDRYAQMQVTINGQLMTMTLIEELELNGIHCISANTDGIIIKLPNDKKQIFKEITERWNETNKMGADGETYKLFVRRDVNNYLNLQIDGSLEFKGALDPKQYIKDLKKGYDMPIVAIAIKNYFLNNTPVMETLRNHKDILDFCKTQNVGRQFDVVYDEVQNGKIVSVTSQRHVRFYVSMNGIVLQKEHKFTHQRAVLGGGNSVTILNSLDDKDIEMRNINYKYYYNECYKIIDPIQLRISPNQKGNSNKKTLSGKALLKKYKQDYLSLFDDM